jgi:hypothetical protein
LPDGQFNRAVFVNCPFDAEYAPLLEAALFCLVYFGFSPRLANERIEAGENRLDKIVGMIRRSKFSIHDLSRCKAKESTEFFRMNMPFEFGIDVGLRRSGASHLAGKKFLVFEEKQYDLKRALSDIAGQDAEFHNGDYASVIKKVRAFFRVEAGLNVPGPSKLISDYATFQGWMTEKKIHEGHSEEDAVNLPTRERLDEMKIWNELGRPTEFKP